MLRDLVTTYRIKSMTSTAGGLTKPQQCCQLLQDHEGNAKRVAGLQKVRNVKITQHTPERMCSAQHKRLRVTQSRS